MKYTTFDYSLLFFDENLHSRKKKTKLPFLKSYTISNLSKKNQNLTS